MKKLIVLWALVFVLGYVAGCRAIHGFGGDLRDWTAPYATPDE